jgi:hypothetical protein
MVRVCPLARHQWMRSVGRHEPRFLAYDAPAQRVGASARLGTDQGPDLPLGDAAGRGWPVLYAVDEF